MNEPVLPKTAKYDPPTISYDGQNLFYNGMNISECCTGMTAIITGNSTKVTLVFEDINVDMKKDFKYR